MNKSKRKLINKVINKVYAISKSSKLRLILLNIATIVFKNSKNRIEFDDQNQIYWLKNDYQYLVPVAQPRFDFSKIDVYKNCRKIFCKHCELDHGDVVVDIGAGIGTEVCFFSEYIGRNGKLYNLEASPSSYHKLAVLTEKNQFSNCLNFNLAIANSNQPIWMEEGDNYVVNTVNKAAKGIMIEAITLDQFVLDNEINAIKLLKVNVEGAEFDMIDGMTEAIHCIENVAISCHDFLFNNQPLIRDKVVSFLTTNQFEIFSENTGNKILDSWVYAKRIHK